jgi:hypothetical protein
LLVTSLGTQSSALEVEVWADNWLAALREGRTKLGEDGGIPQGASCAMSEAGVVTILDAAHRRRYVVQPRASTEGGLCEAHAASHDAAPDAASSSHQARTAEPTPSELPRALAVEAAPAHDEAGLEAAPAHDSSSHEGPAHAGATSTRGVTDSPGGAEPAALLAGAAAPLPLATQPADLSAQAGSSCAGEEVASAVTPASAATAGPTPPAPIVDASRAALPAAAAARPSSLPAPVGEAARATLPPLAAARPSSVPTRAAGSSPATLPPVDSAAIRAAAERAAQTAPATAHALRGVAERASPAALGSSPPASSVPAPVEPDDSQRSARAKQTRAYSAERADALRREFELSRALSSIAPSAGPSEPKGLPRPALRAVPPSERVRSSSSSPAQSVPSLGASAPDATPDDMAQAGERASTQPEGLVPLSARDVDPSEESPLTYRERAYWAAGAGDHARLEALLQAEYIKLRSTLLDRPRGQLIHLAAFDHVFHDKPERPPLATLEWRDWRGTAVFSVTQQGRESVPSAAPEPHQAPAPESVWPVPTRTWSAAGAGSASAEGTLPSGRPAAASQPPTGRAHASSARESARPTHEATTARAPDGAPRRPRPPATAAQHEGWPLASPRPAPQATVDRTSLDLGWPLAPPSPAPTAVGPESTWPVLPATGASSASSWPTPLDLSAEARWPSSTTAAASVGQPARPLAGHAPTPRDALDSSAPHSRAEDDDAWPTLGGGAPSPAAPLTQKPPRTSVAPPEQGEPLSAFPASEATEPATSAAPAEGHDAQSSEPRGGAAWPLATALVQDQAPAELPAAEPQAAPAQADEPAVGAVHPSDPAVTSARAGEVSVTPALPSEPSSPAERDSEPAASAALANEHTRAVAIPATPAADAAPPDPQTSGRLAGEPSEAPAQLDAPMEAETSAAEQAPETTLRDEVTAATAGAPQAPLPHAEPGALLGLPAVPEGATGPLHGSPDVAALVTIPGPVVDELELASAEHGHRESTGEVDGRLTVAFEAMPDLYFLPTPIAGLEFTIGLIAKLVACEAVSACLYDINTDEFRFVALSGPGSSARRASAVKSQSGLFGAAKRAPGDSLIVDDAADDRRYDAQVDGREGLAVRSLAYFPLRLGNQLLGMLQLVNRAHGRSFSIGDVAVLSYVSAQLAEFLFSRRSLRG